MTITTLKCTACSAPIEVTADTDRVTCRYCGTSLEIQHSEGQTAVKLAQQVSSTIQHGTEVTAVELKRLQLSQEASMLQMQLSTLQAEIRSLQREQPTVQIRNQLAELRIQERALLDQIAFLRASLTGSAPAQPRAQRSDAGVTVVHSGAKQKGWLVTYLLCLFLGIFGVHRLFTGHWLIALVQFLTLGGFMFWWIIDLFLIASGKYKDRRKVLLNGPKSPKSRAWALTVSGFVLGVFLGMLLIEDPTAALVMGLVMGGIMFVIARPKKRLAPPTQSVSH